MNVLEVLQKVCDKHNISVFELLGDGRRNKIIDARVEIASILYKEGYSTTEIGIILGRRDHTTVINLLKIAKKKH